MNKEKLGPAATKAEFVKSIHRGLLKILKDMGNEQYSDCFKIEGSSIICNLPPNYFDLYDIPENTKIEIKFITKKS